MPGTRASQLPAAVPTIDDLVYLVDTPGSTPASRRATLEAILALAPSLLVESGAGSKISALTPDFTPSTDDLIPTVNDPSGTPANRAVTIGDLLALQTMVLIDEQTPAGSGVATFAAIPATYRALFVSLLARGTQAATSTGINITFNNDSGANYDHERSSITTSLGASDAFAQNSIGIVFVSAASAPASVASSYGLMIQYYADTTFFKMMNQLYGGLMLAQSTGLFQQRGGTGIWRSAAAINRIDLALASGNFVSGSKFSLYGIR